MCHLAREGLNILLPNSGVGSFTSRQCKVDPSVRSEMRTTKALASVTPRKYAFLPRTFNCAASEAAVHISYTEKSRLA